MVEKEFAIEFLFKEKMLIKSCPVLKSYLIKEFKNGKTKTIPFRHLTLSNAIDALKSIELTSEFDYYDAFVISVAFSREFADLRELLLSTENKKTLGVELNDSDFDLDKNFKREMYWREESIDFNEALYFSCTFLNESYRRVLAADMTLLSNKIRNQKKPEKVGNIYLSTVKKIKKGENR